MPDPRPQDVWAAARGRWGEIVLSFVPQLSEAVQHAGSSRHTHCPVHGGQHGDAFRVLPDFHETGGAVCNTCGTLANGFALISWVTGWNYDDTFRRVAEYLGVEAPRRGRGRPKKQDKEPAKPTLPNHTKPSTAASTAASSTAKRRTTQKVVTLPQEAVEARAKLLARWREARHENSVALAYLHGRGIPLAKLPAAVRFHPELPYQHDDGSFEKIPALLLRVESTRLGIVALHRIYLDVDTDTQTGSASVSKAKVSEPKKLTPAICPGALSGASIRFQVVSTDGDFSGVLAVAEGPETALAVHHATGLPTWSTVTAGGMQSLELPPDLRRLEIWADNDANEVGQRAAEELAARAISDGLEVVVLVPPAAGTDWLDVLNHEGADAIVSAREFTPTRSRPAEEIPEILVHAAEHEVTAQVAAAIASDPSIFQRQGMLVRVIREIEHQEQANNSEPAKRPNKSTIERDSLAPRIDPLPAPYLRERITAACRLVRETKSGDVYHAHPPEWLVPQILNRGHWPGVRKLRAVVETPVLVRDGSVLETPGYHEPSRILLEPLGDFPPVPRSPTSDQIRSAVQRIIDVIQDFPFASAAHQAAWVAAMMTPLARHAFSGPCPLFLMDANVPSAGKSLLCDLISIAVAGRPMARASNVDSEDEMRKRITSIAIGGDPIVLIDNIRGAFGFQCLDAVLTSTTWSDRILGQSKTARDLQLLAVWYATGNNVAIRGDLARRTCHIRLVCQEENPEERSEFAHSDVKEYTYESRHSLVSAALTILRGYFVAGRPEQNIRPWGSFEGWSSVVRAAIVWAGLEDPGLTRQEFAERADSDSLAIRALIDGWEKLDPLGHGLTAAEVLDRVDFSASVFSGNNSELKNAINELCPPRGGKYPSAKQLGSKLRSIEQRVFGGKYIARRGIRGNTVLWTVFRQEGSEGTKGFTLSAWGKNNNSIINNELHTVEATDKTKPLQATRPLHANHPNTPNYDDPGWEDI